MRNRCKKIKELQDVQATKKKKLTEQPFDIFEISGSLAMMIREHEASKEPLKHN